jgi:hypothetical protein
LAVILALFAVSFMLWVGLGMQFAPILVWFGSDAASAASATHAGGLVADLVVPMALLGLVVVPSLRPSRDSTLPRSLPASPHAQRTTHPIATDEQLTVVRTMCDLALQPLEQFNGFDTIDQFREAAWRYQLTSAGYALALHQRIHAPAFTGYLSQAQANLITKHLEPKVWRYWRWENLWGNLRWDPDPIKRENVMLSGYLLLSLGSYEQLSGDHRFHEPGALTFGRYPYDADSIAESVSRQMGASWICAYPCEPNWVFIYCNIVAYLGLMTQDSLTGSTHASVIADRFRSTIAEEFRGRSGQFQTIRSQRFGFSIPGSGAIADLTAAFLLNPVHPDLARSGWDRVRSTIEIDAEGCASMQLGFLDHIDPGTYTISTGFAYSWLAAAAREMGDDEVADAAISTVTRLAPPTTADGAKRWGLSNFANFVLALGVLGERDAFRTLVTGGRPTMGPMLAGVNYPQVLIARAVTDGRDLELTICPDGSSSDTRLLFADLVPHRTYELKGAGVPVVADAAGEAAVELLLHERTDLHLLPV